MKPSLYIETTIISYLVGWLSRHDLYVASSQEFTRQWWAERRGAFDLYASTVVWRRQRTAEIDALHIAIAAVNGMDYFLTWNCRHIANAFILPRVYAVCRRAGYEPPFVCTPPELIGR